ncbi:hypothetical protein [Mitsuaria sp. 7]|uniref:hypothetical protein n=1 Tax=Mitsuaria sp. 7 TaxID=1658665 RepID=UPI0012F9D16B|nr:hypothetical protein [Mitsuaria sp. 7]
MAMNVMLEQAKQLVNRLPPVVGRPQAEFDEIVALLAEPTALFGEPTALFGEPSTACYGSCSSVTAVVDWYRLAEDMDQVLRHHRLRWPQVIQMLQVAAQVLKEHSLQLCNCPPRITRSPKETEFVAMRYELSVDAPWEMGFVLTSDCSWRLIDLDLHELGVRIAFRGRWDGPFEEELAIDAVVEDGDDEDEEYD